MKRVKDEEELERLRKEAEEEGYTLIEIPLLPMISWVLLIPVIGFIGSGKYMIALAYLLTSIVAMIKSKLR